MNTRQQVLFWLIGLIVFGLAVYMLRPILLPFVAAMAVAYLLDPAADRLEKWNISRNAATWLLTVSFFATIAFLLLLLAPLLATQLIGFLDHLPDYVESARNWLRPVVERAIERLPVLGDPATLWENTANLTQGWASWVGAGVAGLWNRGLALFNLLSLLLITPVVAFYLLRDWDRFVAVIDSLLPRQHADTIREQARRVDEVLAAFVRGQGMVALADGLVYATGLSLVGLEFGLVIGLAAGLLSFVPYLGALLGAFTALMVALLQWGLDPVRIGLVIAVFVSGQLLENAVWQPRLLGSRVGLHPVWVIFGVLAGGALFGFVGVLLAVPVAAALGVLIRFAIDRYRGSGIYLGPGSV
ncbi:MAG: AI-2E family transporter [Alphaproteobacteria bacterium]|nr:AI-2E family transporter [Alphaproteobacteria bacterium]